MPRLILVRHGESTWNLEGRLQGQNMEVPLTAVGRSQAAVAAMRVRRTLADGPARVLASDQRRAWQTAAFVAEATGLVAEAEPRLREQHLGAMEGKLASELEPQPVPEGAHISEISWSGGETIEQVWRRCRSLVDSLGGEEPVVLISHGDTLRVLLSVLDGRGHRDVDWVPITNGEVIERQV